MSEPIDLVGSPASSLAGAGGKHSHRAHEAFEVIEIAEEGERSQKRRRQKQEQKSNEKKAVIELLDDDEDDEGGKSAAVPENGGNFVSDDAKEKLSVTLKCHICLDKLIEPTMTKCGHMYCKGCIQKRVRSNKSNAQCPVCRKKISGRDLIRFYGFDDFGCSQASSLAGAGEKHSHKSQEAVEVIIDTDEDEIPEESERPQKKHRQGKEQKQKEESNVIDLLDDDAAPENSGNVAIESGTIDMENNEAFDKLSESGDLSCLICIDKFDEPTVTKCGHMFCKACIQECIVHGNKKCPVCRKSLGAKDLIRFYGFYGVKSSD
jgi:predicted RNA-binding protein YlxR (DUF448 family)